MTGFGEGGDARRLAEELLAHLGADPRLRQVRLTSNRTVLIGLRGDPRTGLRLGIHHHLAARRALWPAIATWIASGGRNLPPELQAGLDQVFADLREEHRAQTRSMPALEPIGTSVDLPALLDEVLRTWFPHLPKPAIGWGRNSPARQRRHIRFACYRRSPPTIQVNPLVGQPWVARTFIDYLLFHELCHHAQACHPLAGETAHSPRFLAWERRYPHYAEAIAWERAHLDRFLGRRND